MERHVHEQLVERSVHEGGVNTHHRVGAFKCHAGCRGKTVLLRDSNVNDSVGEPGGQWLQTHWRHHRGGHSHDLRVPFRKA